MTTNQERQFDEFDVAAHRKSSESVETVESDDNSQAENGSIIRKSETLIEESFELHAVRSHGTSHDEDQEPVGRLKTVFGVETRWAWFWKDLIG